MNRRIVVSVLTEHRGHPPGRWVYTCGPTSLNRYLKDFQAMEESPTRCHAPSTERGQGAHAEPGPISTYFLAPPKPYSRHNFTQQAFYSKLVDTFISSLNSESLVEDPSFSCILAAANPRLTKFSRSTL